METADGRKVLDLPIDAIRPNPCQPRRAFEPEALAALADSVARHGILQPLTVRRTGTGWELVAGERRLRAARLAGFKTAPCLELAADGADSALLALVESLQRQDLHYLEEAAAIAAYLRQTGASQEEAARRLGRSASAVANKLRLLRLGPECREVLVAEGLTERHARCLLRLEDEGERLAAARHMARRGLTVAQAEQYVERRLSLLQSTPPAGRRTFILKDVRLFLNSVDRGLRMIRDAGVDARTERAETEEDIVLTIRIPKRRAAQKDAEGAVVTGL